MGDTKTDAVERHEIPGQQRFDWRYPVRIVLSILLLIAFLYKYLDRPILSHPFIDGHNDLLILLRQFYPDIYDDKFKGGFEKGGLLGQVDLPRIEAGDYGGAFWSAFVPCPANGTDFSDANYAPYVKATLKQIDLFNRLADKYPQFKLTRTAKEARHASLISPLAIEGLHQIGNLPAVLRLYYELGVRYSTLTWNCHNKYADAALVSENGKTVPSQPLWHGLSKDGEDLILEMNRLGMIVDLSHTSVDTMRDVLIGKGDFKGSIAPPIFSHSSVYSICPHPRNVPDDILELVRDRNAVVMINFSPDFISCEADGDLPRFVNETNTIDQVVKHIVYIGEKIGYDYVGIGTDFDGIPTTPRGIEDVSKFPDLVRLLEKKVKRRDVIKIIGGNVLRVWEEVERTAARLQKEMDPLIAV